MSEVIGPCRNCTITSKTTPLRSLVMARKATVRDSTPVTMASMSLLVYERTVPVGKKPSRMDGYVASLSQFIEARRLSHIRFPERHFSRLKRQSIAALSS